MSSLAPCHAAFWVPAQETVALRDWDSSRCRARALSVTTPSSRSSLPTPGPRRGCSGCCGGGSGYCGGGSGCCGGSSTSSTAHRQTLAFPFPFPGQCTSALSNPSAPPPLSHPTSLSCFSRNAQPSTEPSLP